MAVIVSSRSAWIPQATAGNRKQPQARFYLLQATSNLPQATFQLLQATTNNCYHRKQGLTYRKQHLIIPQATTNKALPPQATSNLPQATFQLPQATTIVTTASKV